MVVTVSGTGERGHVEQTLMLDVHQEIKVAKKIRTQQQLVHICDDELRLEAPLAARSCRSRGAEPVGKAGWHHTQSGPRIDEETTPG